MKTKNIIPITILALFYIITLFKTVLLYYAQIYFPDLGYIVSINVISQEFAPYSLIIKLIMILIVLSIIPGYFILKKNIKEQDHYTEKIPTFLTMMFAFIPPILALINNFTSGDFLFSIALIIYGVIFTTITIKFS